MALWEDKVSALQKVSEQRDNELEVLRKWQTATLIPHGVFIPLVQLHLPVAASATFVWSLIYDKDKIRGCTMCDPLSSK